MLVQCQVSYYLLSSIFFRAQCENEMIYEPGEPCQQDEDCFTYPKSKCSSGEGLCLAPPEEPGKL